jgi:DNA primase
VDGRAKLAALARPLFARIPEGVYRELLADRLAAEIRMPAAKLKELLLAGGPAAPSVPASEPAPAARSPRMQGGRMMSSGRGNLLTQAISLVLHHPVAAAAVTDRGSLSAIDKAGIGVLVELLDQAASLAQPSTAALLERWRDRPEFGRLTALAAADPLVADPGAARRELQMAVRKLLEEHGPGRRMNELLRKAEEIGLNPQEKTELKDLLSSKSRPGNDT